MTPIFVPRRALGVDLDKATYKYQEVLWDTWDKMENALPFSGTISAD